MQWCAPQRFLVPALKCGLLAAAAFYIAAFVGNATVRVPYKYELEWMEGGVVCHVERVLEGKSIYCEPSAEFVPFIYTPFYYYVSAAVARVVGLGFFPLRLVSLIASLGCASLIMLIVVRRAHAPAFFGFLAAGFFMACFCVTGRWLDIARVDPLFLMLLLSSIYAFQSPKPSVNSVLAAILMFLAFFTKQTALMVALPLCLWSVLFRTGWSRISFSLVFFAFLGLSTLLMNGVSDGWYSYYVFSLPKQHGIQQDMYWGYWQHDIFDYAGIAFIASALCIFRGRHASRGEWCFDLAVLGSLLFASWFSRLHSGGYLNVLLPAFAALAIFFGIGLFKAVAQAGNRRWLAACCYAIAIFQFQQMFFQPSDQIPSRAATETGDMLMETIASVDGNVFMSSHPWYPGMTGKGTCAQNMAISDILRASASSTQKAQIQADILRRIEHRTYGALILDTREFPVGSRELEENYRLVDSNLTPPIFTPLTGCALHPTFLYVRKDVLWQAKNTAAAGQTAAPR